MNRPFLPCPRCGKDITGTINHCDLCSGKPNPYRIERPKPNPIQPFDFRRKPPYPSKPKAPWIRENRPMTIAAGFNFRQGILLCADTEQTAGQFKTKDSKILQQAFADTGHIAFALAGDVYHATMAVQEIFKDLTRKPTFTKDDVEEVTKSRVEYIYEHLIYPYPQVLQDAPFFDLIGAIWTKSDGLNLLAYSRASVAWFPKYTCRGIGLSLAEYLIKPLYSLGMSRSEIESLATYMLTHVKGSISGCGGDSEFLIVDEAGMHPIELQAKTEHEDFVEIFDTYLPFVYEYAGDLAKSDEEVTTMLQAFTEALMSQRAEFREKRKKIERLKANIKQIQESKS